MKLRFLIYISYSYAVPIGNPLEKEILKQGHEIKWFSDEKEGAKALQAKKNRFSEIKEVINYQPHVVLAATNAVADFISGIKVQIFHGFNAEKRSSTRGHFRIRGFFDLYCTQGPSTTIPFQEIQQRHPHFEVVETGWSKVDPLFPLTEKKPSKKPGVFIASTFTEKLSLAVRNDVFTEIKRLSKSKKYIFNMVLHPKTSGKIREKWQSLENENFTFHHTTNLIPLFKMADIMFADTTSATKEFGLQLKPIVTFNHNAPKSFLINIKSVNEIESAFKKALQNPKDKLGKLIAYNDKLHPYTDGESSARIINACIAFLYKDKSHLKKKPLNLVRKFKMRQKLNYFTLKTYRKPFQLSEGKS